MAFAIMRAKKLNSMGTVAAALQHCYRDRETPNADQERTPYNDHLAARSTDEAMGKLRERLPEKRRKDAVLAVEYVMSASPEWWQTASADQQREFFKRSTECLGRMPKIQMLGDGDELNKGNERYPARQDTDIHEVSMVSAPHRSGPATSRRLDDWRLLGGSPTEPKEHQPQRNQYRHRRGVTDHGPRCVIV